jgi:hypothetical protein
VFAYFLAKGGDFLFDGLLGHWRSLN